MFKEYQKGLRLPELEKEILSFWEENGIFEKSVQQSKHCERFVFYEGPPTANGKPGIHHVISRTIKDLVCRYYTMLGYHVPRKAGWDTHGLPVEIEIEKLLGIECKEQIEIYGVEKFNKLCRESAFKYVKDWEELTQRMGYWLDYKNPYITYDRNYIETVWWLLKQLWEKNLLYSGHKILPYCPRCETGLSSHEVSLGYQEVVDPSVFVKMKFLGLQSQNYLVNSCVYGSVPEWLKGTGCKPVSESLRWFESSPAHLFLGDCQYLIFVFAKNHYKKVLTNIVILLESK